MSRTLATGVLLSALALGACSSAQPPERPPANEPGPGQQQASAAAEESTTEATVAQWPRTITVGEREVTIEQEPVSIVAVTSETADLALLLAGPERIRAVAAPSQSPHSGTAVDLATQVETTLPPGTDPDPEYLLSLDPDLVISTARHGGEQIAAEQLEATGVPVLNFPSDAFGTPEGLAEVIVQLGEALGEETAAAEMSDELLHELEHIDDERAGNAPTALALMARGNQVMAMDSSAMLPHLVERAGGTNAATTVGITQTRPIDAELIAKANPEVIFLEDFQGQGEAPFEALLNNPALADVPAIRDGQVHVVAMTQASAISGLNTPEGYGVIVEIINGVE